MRRRVVVLLVSAGLVASGIVAGLYVPAASQGTGADTFTLCSKAGAGYNRNINVGPRRFGPGDMSVAIEPLFNPRTGARVGRDVNHFTFVKPIGRQDGLAIVDVTVNLRGGKLTVYGAFRFSQFRRGAKFTITGGTGAYSNAGGSVTVTSGRCDGARGDRLRFNVV
jgi:hypothetical protein